MEIGVTVRNMGPQSTAGLLGECVTAAETLGFESVWITDHIAIPPDDAEGSDGRYLDPLITLSYLAGMTSRIRLGTGVLILPYRTALPTAKQIATLQEVSRERLLLGVGIGWMDAEFRALGINRHQRGAQSDAVLELVNRCFASAAAEGTGADVVTANSQPFLFRPNPPRPPIYIGGSAKHALPRALAHDAGWIPMGTTPEKLEPAIADYRKMCERAGKEPRGITVMQGLPTSNSKALEANVAAYRDLGVERLVCALRYDEAAQFLAQAERLARALA
jgi:probable F420-dependent oxidoreductase